MGRGEDVLNILIVSLSFVNWILLEGHNQVSFGAAKTEYYRLSGLQITEIYIS